MASALADEAHYSGLPASCAFWVRARTNSEIIRVRSASFASSHR